MQRKASKTLWTMNHERKFSSSVLVAWTTNSSQTGFSMTLYVLNPYGVSAYSMLNSLCELLDHLTQFKYDKFEIMFSYTSITRFLLHWITNPQKISFQILHSKPVYSIHQFFTAVNDHETEDKTKYLFWEVANSLSLSKTDVSVHLN